MADDSTSSEDEWKTAVDGAQEFLANAPWHLGEKVAFVRNSSFLTLTNTETTTHQAPFDSLPQRLTLNTKNERDGKTLWTKSQWASAILQRNQMETSMSTLTEKVQQFEKQATSSQKKRLHDAEHDLIKILSKAKEGQRERLTQDQQKPWQKKLSSGLHTFCETVLHYEKVLDVLNEQAPIYTSAVWGAIKILLMANVNNDALKKRVMAYLEEIGQQFRLMKVIVDLQPSEEMINAVTAAYKDFAMFLEKAVKYYLERASRRVWNTVARPWETRFESVVDRIKSHIVKITQLADVGHVILSTKTQNRAEELWHGQSQIRESQSMICQTQRDLHQTQVEMQQEHRLAFNTLSRYLERSCPGSESHIKITNGSTIEVPKLGERVFIELLKSFQVPSKAQENKGNPDDFLAYYARPGDRVNMFRDKVFPYLYRIGDDLGKCTRRYPINDPKWSIGTRNLRKCREVLSCLESIRSELIWIDGNLDTGKSDWTTNFALEVTSAAKTHGTIAVLMHFCGEQPRSRPEGALESVIQSMIFQLIHLHYFHFSWDTCRKYNLHRTRFQEAHDSMIELWKIFEECLEITRTKCVYLVIDNIDALYPQPSDGEENERFVLFIERLKALVLVSGVTCKILITTRQPSGHHYLSSNLGSPMDPTRHKVICIPHGTQRGPEVFGRPKRIFRLPTRRDSFPQNLAEPETLLAMNDEDEDEDEDEKEMTCSQNGGSESSSESDLEDWDVAVLNADDNCSRYLESAAESESDSEGCTEPVSNRQRLHQSDSEDSDFDDSADFAMGQPSLNHGPSEPRDVNTSSDEVDSCLSD